MGDTIVYGCKFDENGMPRIYPINRFKQFTKLTSSENAVETIRHFYDVDTLTEEHVWMLVADSKANIVGAFEIAFGTYDWTPVDVRAVFMKLILTGHKRFIILHNHLSGEVEPSGIDEKLTKGLIKASNILMLEFMDHIIIGKDKYYSFAKEKRDLWKIDVEHVDFGF